MEQIKIQDHVFNVTNIYMPSQNILVIVFDNDIPDLSLINTSIIEIFTNGGIKCATITGYTQIFDINENTVILSNDNSVYTIPIYLVDDNGYIIKHDRVAKNELTKFTIQTPIDNIYWCPKWNFEDLNWEESGVQPTNLELLVDELSLAILDNDFRLCLLELNTLPA